MAKRKQPSQRPAVQPSAAATAPRPWFVLVDAKTGGLVGVHPYTAAGEQRQACPIFTSEEDAWRGLLGGADHEVAERLRSARRVAPLVAIAPPPPRATPWGEGQFDYCELAPGLQAGLRVTADGDVVLLSPAAGEIVITKSMLSVGIAEANRRAAEVRSDLMERAYRCKHSPLCKRCDQPLFYLRGAERVEARMQCPKAGKHVGCIPRDRDVPRRRGARGGR